MWEKFTEEAKRIVYSAQEVARAWGSRYVGTEHLLEGMLTVLPPWMPSFLDKMGVTSAMVTERLRSYAEVPNVSCGPTGVTDMSLTPRTKRVVDLSYLESRRMGDAFIGSEHLLLGLLKEQDGLAGKVLASFGATHALWNARVAVMREASQSEAIKVANAINFVIVEKPSVLHVNGRYKSPWGGVFKLIGCDPVNQDVCFISVTSPTADFLRISIPLSSLPNWELIH